MGGQSYNKCVRPSSQFLFMIRPKSSQWGYPLYDAIMSPLKYLSSSLRSLVTDQSFPVLERWKLTKCSSTRGLRHPRINRRLGTMEDSLWSFCFVSSCDWVFKGRMPLKMMRREGKLARMLCSMSWSWSQAHAWASSVPM